MKTTPRKPRTVRRRWFKAPLHRRRRALSAPLSPELRAQYGTRSMPVRRGDTIVVLRGDWKMKEGKVTRIDSKRMRIYIEGLTREKMDGSTVPIPLRPWNVMITKLDLSDPWRKRIVGRRGYASKVGEG
ncbi:MAG: 50S ribosomal protein L24 [Candidatus Bathyarchaeota archaeon B23]|nr:MAG: 50S ribosomal protein L24 [Candidatus Bathyarchaeota archaeon B23]